MSRAWAPRWTCARRAFGEGSFEDRGIRPMVGGGEVLTCRGRARRWPRPRTVLGGPRSGRKEGGEGRGAGGEVGGARSRPRRMAVLGVLWGAQISQSTGFRGLSLDPAPDPTWAAPGRPAGEETGASGAQASGTVSTREHGIACPVPSASSLRALQGTDALGNAALTSPLRHRQPRSSLGAGGQAEVTETLPGSLLSLPQKYSYIRDPKRSFL